MLYVRKPGDDNETTIRFADDDPFFSEVNEHLHSEKLNGELSIVYAQVSNLIDVIEDIEEDPEGAQILSSFEGAILLFYIYESGN